MVSFHIKAGLNYVQRSVESFGQPVGDVDSVVGDEDDVDDGANDKQQSTHVTYKPTGGAPAGPLRAGRPWAGGLWRQASSSPR